jgi:hypothetical protein
VRLGVGSLTFRRECRDAYVEMAATRGVDRVAREAVECERAAAKLLASGDRSLAANAAARAREARSVVEMTTDEIDVAARKIRRRSGRNENGSRKQRR